METIPITIEEYARIFDTVHAILTAAGEDVNHSCLFFSILGVLVLQEYHKIEAEVCVGCAALKLRQDGGTLYRGTVTGSEYGSNENAFHSWVEIEDWCVDFSAPVIPDICKEKNMNGIEKRGMFLKKKCHMASSLEDMRSEGEFLFERNDHLRESMIADFFAERSRRSIADLMCYWYRRPPEQMLDGVVSERLGRIRYVSHKLNGEW